MLAFSCSNPEQEISWDTQSIPQKLIVDGTITTDFGNHPIILKLTDNYFANKHSTYVSDAIIEVVTEDETYRYSEDQQSPGTYKADIPFAGKLLNKYSLNIELLEEIDKTKSYSAQTELNEGTKIDSISAEQYLNIFQTEEEDSLAIFLIVYGQEPINIRNYYLLKLFRNGEAVSDTITDYTIFSDQETGSDGVYGFSFLVNEEYVPGDTLGVELYSIPRGYFEFIKGIREISEPGDPFGFSGPPANAVSNINNGKALGFYYAAYVSRGETIVEGDY